MIMRKSVNEYLKQLKNGGRCFEEFYNAVFGCIKYIAYKYLIDKSHIDDVIMNTICNVMNNIKDFDEQKNGKAWICKIAQNEAYKINLRAQKHKDVSIEELSEEIACTSDAVDSAELIFDLEQSIQKLDDIDRQIVEMRLLNDMKYKDIAKELNMHVGSVYKRYKICVGKINKDIFD